MSQAEVKLQPTQPPGLRVELLSETQSAGMCCSSGSSLAGSTSHVCTGALAYHSVLGAARLLPQHAPASSPSQH